jgi:hypothetical protein
MSLLPRAGLATLTTAVALTISVQARAVPVADSWDLTQQPTANDSGAWLLPMPGGGSAPAIPRFLGHSATYTGAGGNTLVLDAYYAVPGLLADFQTAFLHRATETNSAIGVCDFRSLNGAGTATICGGGDSSSLDGDGNIDVVRITLPTGGWKPGSLTLVALGAADTYRVYASNDAIIDLGDLDAVVASGNGGTDPFTVVFDDEIGAFQYLFVTSGDLDGDAAGNGLRIAGLTAFQSSPLVVSSPDSLSLFAAACLVLAARIRARRGCDVRISVGIRRRGGSVQRRGVRRV